MKNLTLALTSLMLAATLAQAAAPIVSNVTATQRAGTTLVDIRYDVADADGDALTVSVVLTSGATTLPATTLTGAVGAGVMPGTGKLITWDAGADWPNKLATDVVAKVTADDGKAVMPTGLYVVVDLSAGPNASSYPVTTLTAVPTGGWTDTHKTTRLVLRRISKGTFMMGSPTTELGRYTDEDRHQVTLTQDFYIGVFEVTQKQWERVMGTSPSTYTGDMRPVESVSYNTIRGSTLGAQWPANSGVDATSFMGRLRARTGLIFDLPTEAQWEYACRAGTTTALNSGKNITSTTTACPNMAEVGRYYFNENDGKGGYTDVHTKVGSYKSNAWGLYDMHGNGVEWCLDWYMEDLGTAAQTNPKGATTGSRRLHRGGGYDYAQDCRAASRSSYFPNSSIGGGSGLRAAIQP